MQLERICILKFDSLVFSGYKIFDATFRGSVPAICLTLNRHDKKSRFNCGWIKNTIVFLFLVVFGKQPFPALVGGGSDSRLALAALDDF